MKADKLSRYDSSKGSSFIYCSFFLFITALALRLGFALFAYVNNAAYMPDSYDYTRLADSLVKNFTYAAGSSEIFRVPVYSVFIAIIKYISASHFIIVVLTIQSILDSLTALMVFFMAMKIFNFEGKSLFFPLVAGFFYALSPLAIASVSHILTETLFTFLLTFTCLVLIRTGVEKLSFLHWCFVGLMMAILTLTRAVFMPLTLLFCFFVLIKTKNIKTFLITGITCCILLFGWALRNYLNTGYFGVSSVSAINTYRYNACALESNLKHESFAETQEAFDRKLLTFNTQNDKALYASEEGWKIIIAHPLEYAFIHFRTSLNTLLPSSGDLTKAFGLQTGEKGTLAIINSKGLIEGIKYYFAGNLTLFFVLLPLSAILLLQYILFIIGAVKSLKARNEYFIIMLFLILIAIYLILVGGPASTPRFRLPAEPIIFAFASYGLYVTCKLLSRHKNGK